MWTRLNILFEEQTGLPGGEIPMTQADGRRKRQTPPPPLSAQKPASSSHAPSSLRRESSSSHAQGPAPVPQPAAQPDMATLVNTLLHRIEAQEAEIRELRNQLPPLAQVPMRAAAQADPQVVPQMG